MIVAAVAVATAKRHVYITVGEGQCSALPVDDPIESGRRQLRLAHDGSTREVQGREVIVNGSGDVDEAGDVEAIVRDVGSGRARDSPE